MIQGIEWDKLSSYVGKSTDLAVQYVRLITDEHIV